MRKNPLSKIWHIEMCQKSGKVAPVYGMAQLISNKVYII